MAGCSEGFLLPVYLFTSERFKILLVLPNNLFVIMVNLVCMWSFAGEK